MNDGKQALEDRDVTQAQLCRKCNYESLQYCSGAHLPFARTLVSMERQFQVAEYFIHPVRQDGARERIASELNTLELEDDESNKVVVCVFGSYRQRPTKGLVREEVMAQGAGTEAAGVGQQQLTQISQRMDQQGVGAGRYTSTITLSNRAGED